MVRSILQNEKYKGDMILQKCYTVDLLRRVPWKVIIDERHSRSQELDHIRQLAIERNVDIEYERLNNYKCCGLIKQLSDI